MLLRNSLVRCDLHHRTRILPRLTGNEVVVAQIESKGAQCKCEQGERPVITGVDTDREGPVAGRTNRARVYITSKLRGCSWTSRKDPPLGAAIALAQDSFDRDKTR